MGCWICCRLAKGSTFVLLMAYGHQRLRSQGSTLHGLIHYGLRPPTSWRFTHTRPRGNQRLFPLGTPSRPATFSNSEKVAIGINPAFDRVCNRLRPYSKMLTLQMGRPFPSKASSPSMASSRHFLQLPQVQS